MPEVRTDADGGEWADVLSVLDVLPHRYPFVLVGLLDGASGAIGYFAAAHRVRFRKLPRAGDTLLLSVELVQYRRGVARLEGVASLDGALSTSAEFTAVVRGRAA